MKIVEGAVLESHWPPIGQHQRGIEPGGKILAITDGGRKSDDLRFWTKMA